MDLSDKQHKMICDHFMSFVTKFKFRDLKYFNPVLSPFCILDKVKKENLGL